MAKRKGIVPEGKLDAMLELYVGDAEEEMEEGMLRLTHTLEAKAVELAPVDTGELQNSAFSTIRRGRGSMIVGVVDFNAPHAAAAHELPQKARGPGTRAKPGNEFGLAGPKYLERPLRAMQELMTKELGVTLREFWGRQSRGGRAR